jgi:thiosulfate dehydrogenase [quinone] large subunit
MRIAAATDARFPQAACATIITDSGNPSPSRRPHMIDNSTAPGNEPCWAAFFLRLAMALLFLVAAVNKFQVGPAVFAEHAAPIFKGTWLPAPLVSLHLTLLPWIELSIGLWLLVGFRLKAAWIVTCLILISLAVGMSVAEKHDVAASNYNYLLIAAIGLYLSRHDCLTVDACLAGRCALGGSSGEPARENT